MCTQEGNKQMALRMARYERRTILRAGLAGAATAATAAVLAACGETAAPTAAVPTAAPRPTTAPATAATVAPTTASVAATTAPAAVASSAPAMTAATTAPAAAATTAPGAAATTAPRPSVAAMTAAAAAPGMPDADGKVASLAPGVPDVYTTFPKPFKTVNTVPGKGSKVTALLVTYNPPPPPRNENKWWQEFEKRLGVTWEPILQPADGYPMKLAGLVASGDLPDLTFLYFEQVPDQYKLIQQGAYTDLTSELSGDNLKQYPNLARLPDFLWKNARVNGKLYGAPRPLLPTGAQAHWRKDWAEKLGNPNPKNGDELLDLFTKFTKGDPDGNGRQDTYAIHTIQQFTFGLNFFSNMHRVPNQWRKNPDGTLTAYLETPEFKQTLEYMKRLFDAGVFHPETATGNRTMRKDFITGGKVGFVMDALTSWAGPNPNGFRDTARKLANDPKINVTTLVPPGFDGGKATTDLTSGFTGFAAIPAKVGRDKERVKELLRVVDYMASPFGSEEWQFLTYGLEGTHHTLGADGSRVLNDLGRNERGGGDLHNATNGMQAYWYPIVGDAQEAQVAIRDVLALGVENPVESLFSPTFASRAGVLNQMRIDRVGSIVQGREPLSALDTFIKDWRAQGGDMARKEFEAGLKG